MNFLKKLLQSIFVECYSKQILLLVKKIFCFIQPSQEEIITFVKNQWQLSDLREINNENGSLPKNLTNTKCTSLPGRYILQV